VRRWLRNPLGHVVTPSDEPGKVAIEYTTDDVPDRSLEEAWQQLKHTLETGCVRPDGEHVSDGEMRFDAGAWTQLQKDLLDLCEPALFCRAPKCLLTKITSCLKRGGGKWLSFAGISLSPDCRMVRQRTS
jgi:hypothetical protein